jgi:hypothetical protein
MRYTVVFTGDMLLNAVQQDGVVWILTLNVVHLYYL